MNISNSDITEKGFIVSLDTEHLNRSRTKRFNQLKKVQLFVSKVLIQIQHYQNLQRQYRTIVKNLGACKTEELSFFNLIPLLLIKQYNSSALTVISGHLPALPQSHQWSGSFLTNKCLP